MTFKQAYKYAIENSATFRAFDAKVKAAIENGTDSGCMIFSTEPGSTFYYGFDGVDIHKGRHTARRSSEILDRAQSLIIL